MITKLTRLAVLANIHVTAKINKIYFPDQYFSSVSGLGLHVEGLGGVTASASATILQLLSLNFP